MTPAIESKPTAAAANALLLTQQRRYPAPTRSITVRGDERAGFQRNENETLMCRRSAAAAVERVDVNTQEPPYSPRHVTRRRFFCYRCAEHRRRHVGKGETDGWNARGKRRVRFTVVFEEKAKLGFHFFKHFIEPWSTRRNARVIGQSCPSQYGGAVTSQHQSNAVKLVTK